MTEIAVILSVPAAIAVMALMFVVAVGTTGAELAQPELDGGA